MCFPYKLRARKSIFLAEVRFGKSNGKTSYTMLAEVTQLWVKLFVARNRYIPIDGIREQSCLFYVIWFEYYLM